MQIIAQQVLLEGGDTDDVCYALGLDGDDFPWRCTLSPNHKTFPHVAHYTSDDGQEIAGLIWED